MFFRPCYFLDHQFFEFHILLDHDLLKNGESQGAIETTPISSGLPVAFIGANEILDLDIKTMVVLELVHQQREGELIPDQRRLCFHLLSDELLLFFVHLELFLELVFAQFWLGLLRLRWGLRIGLIGLLRLLVATGLLGRVVGRRGGHICSEIQKLFAMI